MIDKELIRQAAEDIDIFEADLSQEFDRIAYQRKSIRLWPWAVAACLVGVVCITLPMMLTKDYGDKSIVAEVRTQTTKDSAHQTSSFINSRPIPDMPISPRIAKAEDADILHPPKASPTTKSHTKVEPKINQESTEVNEMELMCELLDEVTLQTVAEEKYEEHLYYTLMEEICTNASNEPNLPELSL